MISVEKYLITSDIMPKFIEGVDDCQHFFFYNSVVGFNPLQIFAYVVECMFY